MAYEIRPITPEEIRKHLGPMFDWPTIDLASSAIIRGLEDQPELLVRTVLWLWFCGLLGLLNLGFLISTRLYPSVIWNLLGRRLPMRTSAWVALTTLAALWSIHNIMTASPPWAEQVKYAVQLCLVSLAVQIRMVRWLRFDGTTPAHPASAWFLRSLLSWLGNGFGPDLPLLRTVWDCDDGFLQVLPWHRLYQHGLCPLVPVLSRWMR